MHTLDAFQFSAEAAEAYEAVFVPAISALRPDLSWHRADAAALPFRTGRSTRCSATCRRVRVDRDRGLTADRPDHPGGVRRDPGRARLAPFTTPDGGVDAPLQGRLVAARPRAA